MDLHSVGWSSLSTVQTIWRVGRYNLLVWLTRKIPESSVGARLGPAQIVALAGSAAAPRVPRKARGRSGRSSSALAGRTKADIEVPMAEQQVSEKPVDQRKPQAVRKPRGFWSANPIVVLWGTMVGKKVVMAVTGVILVGFVIAHMIGNIKVFIGVDTFNAYAAFLRTMGEPLLPYSALLWVARSILLISALLHIVAAVELTLMNRAARLHGYEAKKSTAATIASLSMRWSGVLLAAFHRLSPAASDGWARRFQGRPVLP